MGEMHQGAIKITVSNPVTGEVLETQVIDNNYVVICAGNRYVKNLQIIGRTHMIAVAVDKSIARATGSGGA